MAVALKTIEKVKDGVKSGKLIDFPLWSPLVPQLRPFHSVLVTISHHEIITVFNGGGSPSISHEQLIGLISVRWLVVVGLIFSQSESEKSANLSFKRPLLLKCSS